MLKRLIDVDKKTRYKINYYFKTKKLNKYYDEYNYVCFNVIEYLNIKKEKRGKKRND